MTGIAVKDVESSGMVGAQLASLVKQGHTVDEAAQMMEMPSAEAAARLRVAAPALVADVDVTPEEVKMCFTFLKSTVRDPAESSGLRSKNARWLIDEAKGRNQLKAGVTGSSVNVLIINERLESAQKRKAASLGLPTE